MFLTLMVVGLVGLFMMAVPAFGRLGHGHGPALTHGHGHGHAAALGRAGHAGPSGHAAHLATARPAPAPGEQEIIPADTAPRGLLRFVPSPRAVFTVLALYGAFGNALLEASPLGFAAAALLAIVPALAVERLLVRRLWNLLFRFQGQPSSSLHELLYVEARAVVPFRNGRGMVSVERDGRSVQLSARLREDQRALPIKVGERLLVEDVDARHERVTVSVLRDPPEPSA